MTAITTSAKVAHNFPRSLFETARKRCNSNDTNSMFEQAAGELRAKLLNDSGARGRWQGLGDTKSARNFPRSLLKTAQKRCNSNDTNSNSEIVTGELRAKLLSSRQDGATHSTPRVTGVEGAGGSGGHGRASRRGAEQSEVALPRGRPGPPAPGTPVGPQAGQPSGRAGRRPQRSPAPLQGPTAPGTPAAPQATQRPPRHASNPAPQMRDGVSPTQSGGRV